MKKSSTEERKEEWKSFTSFIASAFALQSARDVWKTLRHPSTKNPRKFMQTYCIFIHLGV